MASELSSRTVSGALDPMPGTDRSLWPDLAVGRTDEFPFG